VARDIEHVGKRVMNRDEALEMSPRLEALPDPFSSPDGLMGFSARLFRPLCDRCSTPGMISRFAAS
jgi:hypothetical protein